MRKFNHIYLIFLFFSFFTLINSDNSYAQFFPAGDLLPAAFHRERREALRDKLPPRSVAVLFAGPVRNRSNDVDYPYHQDPDFFYLTGLSEPDAVLLVFKDDQQNREGKKYNEIIFVRPGNKWEELWTGGRLGIEGVKNRLGFDMVYADADFRYYDPVFRKFSKILFRPLPGDIRDNHESGDLYDLVEWFVQKIQNADSVPEAQSRSTMKSRLDNRMLGRIMSELREIKTPQEITLIQRAVDITSVGFIEAMKAAHPGISEREMQGIHEFIHRKYGAEAEGYPPIVGSGNNTCTLHYDVNARQSTDSGDLILMDVGAQYNGYSADITRTIPVSGRFSPEQEQIYNLVLMAQQACIDLCRQGISFSKFEKTGREVIAGGLQELGIIKTAGDADNYFPHGLSHHIGLDVHDPGSYNDLEENMIITVEPGIYIPEGSPCDKKWWKTGIRIEDDLLVQKNGCRVLSGMTPKTIGEVEKTMEQPGMLDHYPFPELQGQ